MRFEVRVAVTTKINSQNWHSVVWWITANILKTSAASNSRMDYGWRQEVPLEHWQSAINYTLLHPPKIVKVCWKGKTVIFQLLSVMLINKQREHSNIRHSIIPCFYDNTGLTGNSSCLFDTFNAYNATSSVFCKLCLVFIALVGTVGTNT
jgi:hypothetical protein